ncbi:hypothetical protein MTR_5g036455 [Medicago truncatula]|uniref:Uncharacterized protein n=1 Tax=Medicago truncatula TaxID=3880 RepID=A0A072UPK4_MEDTR|nr:hypothetical protein MTR_5g036455 [Medicago truncatula]
MLLSHHTKALLEKFKGFVYREIVSSYDCIGEKGIVREISMTAYPCYIEAKCVCKLATENVRVTSALTLQLWRGFYHDRYKDIVEDSFPHLVIAPNAGIAAYSIAPPLSKAPAERIA